MDQQIVDNYIIANSKYFEASAIPSIREYLLRLNESQFRAVQFLDYKDPVILLIVSIVVGSFGIDRFLLGQTGLGIVKLITCGGLGIWTIIDWILIMNETKKVNLEILQRASSGFIYQ